MPGTASPIVVMGVSGAGKTTVGQALARRLGVPFEDADDLHPEANVAKMSRGEPLDDDDRRPWLDIVGEWLAEHDHGGVVACSALKRRYRDQLRGHCADVRFLYLLGRPELIEERHRGRQHHFMPTSMLHSQFDTLEPLEPDENGVAIDVSASVAQIVGHYVAATGATT